MTTLQRNVTWLQVWRFFFQPLKTTPRPKKSQTTPQKNRGAPFFFSKGFKLEARLLPSCNVKNQKRLGAAINPEGTSCRFLPRQGVRSLLQKTWGFFGWIFGKQSNGSMVSLEWIHALPVFFPSSQSGVGFRLDWTLKNGYVRSKKV